jgi:glutathione synthase
MRLLFIADPVASFNIKKDTTCAMMMEAARRGYDIFACGPEHVSALAGGRVVASAMPIAMTGRKPDWFTAGARETIALADFSGVLMRKDPPFDIEYFYATHLLEFAERQGAKVFNSGASLRNHPEKLAILEFPQFTATTFVSRDMDTLKAFYRDCGDVVYKPLDGMGGTGVFRAGPGERNLNVIIEMLTDMGRQTIMAQQFVPQISEGDKRILLIDGVPVPYCLARIPKAGETRGNLAAGGTGVARPLTESDLAISYAIGPVLAARGLLLAGIDVIGDKLTEINVTSPTCFQEITEQSGCNVAALFIDALDKHTAQ